MLTHGFDSHNACFLWLIADVTRWISQTFQANLLLGFTSPVTMLRNDNGYEAVELDINKSIRAHSYAFCLVNVLNRLK